MIVNKPVIRIGQNEEAKVNVVVGNGNYTVRSFNTAIATATVSGELITVKSGSQNGATTVEVMDGEGVVANISVNVGVFELEVNEPEVILEVAGEKQLIVSMGNFPAMMNCLMRWRMKRLSAWLIQISSVLSIL